MENRAEFLTVSAKKTIRAYNQFGFSASALAIGRRLWNRSADDKYLYIKALSSGFTAFGINQGLIHGNLLADLQKFILRVRKNQEAGR